MLKKQFIPIKNSISSIAIILGLTLSPFIGAASFQISTEKGVKITHSPEDKELLGKIQEEISKKYPDVTVQVSHGTVILQGKVKNIAEKEALEKMVLDIKGVTTLKNNIVTDDYSVNNPSKDLFPQDLFVTPADNALNKKIRDSVSRNWLWNKYTDIALQTSHGTVTLVGMVDNLSDRDQLASDVEDIYGIKTINNELRAKKNR